MEDALARPDWLEKLDAALPLFGHRNWIVIADAAYPAHAAPAVETLVGAEGHLEVLQAVLERVDGCRHLRASVHLDAELAAVGEEDAPGASAYRNGLAGMLAGRPLVTAAHEEILRKVDEAARRFRVLILKTPMRIPYTSVFLELGCGYWTEDAERRLRGSMNGTAAPAR